MTDESSFGRRGFLVAGAALAASTIGARNALADGANRSDSRPISSGKLKAIVEATTNCQKVGEACLALSAKQLGQGMTAMSRCQKSCINMLALTRAMLVVASHGTADANLIVGLAAVTAKACRECEAACAEFETAQYKDCAESCRRTAEACEALLNG